MTFFDRFFLILVELIIISEISLVLRPSLRGFLNSKCIWLIINIINVVSIRQVYHYVVAGEARVVYWV